MLPEDIQNSAYRNVVIHGHRGARGLYPENTVTAFLGAVKLGVDALEMDVVISKDNKVVVSHEAWMNHLFCTKPDGTVVENDPGKYNLYRMNYNEISRYDCGKKGHPDFPKQQALAEHKPLLGDVLIAVEDYLKKNLLPPVNYNIELKTELPDGLFNPPPAVFVKLLQNEIKELKPSRRVHLQSFDVRILQEIKREKLPLSIGLLVEDKESIETHLHRLGFVPDVYSPEFVWVKQEVLQEVRRLGMLCIPWTVNEQDDMLRLLALGVDGLITDYPDRAIRLIRQKN